MKRKFTVGQRYFARFMNEDETVYACEIMKRTQHYVTISDSRGTRKVKVHQWDMQSEVIYPLGQYSMCIVLKA